MHKLDKQRRWQFQFMVAAVLAILVTPTAILIASRLQGGVSLSPFALFSDRSIVGEVSRFDDEPGERSFVSKITAPFERRSARVFDQSLRRGNRKVVIGEEGWLFYRPALDYAMGPPIGSPENPSASEDVILTLRDELSALGITLIVVPVPVKATVYPDRLNPRMSSDSAPNNRGYRDWLERLQDRDILIADPTSDLVSARSSGRETYLVRDTHWNPVGAQIAATKTAAAVALFLKSSANIQRDDGNALFDHRMVNFRGQGDLQRMLSYGENEEGSNDNVLVRQVVATAHRHPPAKDNTSPVLLLGDSFSLVFSDSKLKQGKRGGFPEHLADALGQSIDVIAMPGADPMNPWRVIERNPQKLAGRRVIVWEFTQRALAPQVRAWTPLHLPPASEINKERKQPREAMEVELEVADVSRVPGNFDYPDCLMIVRYHQLDHPGSDDLFVAHHAWRGGSRTKYVSLQPGRRFGMRLEAIERHIDLETSCWIDTVGSGTELWWATRMEERR